MTPSRPVPAAVTAPGSAVPAPAPEREPDPPGAARPGRVLLAAPRGYRAGVDRAMNTVEEALERHGPIEIVRTVEERQRFALPRELTVHERAHP